MNRPPPHDPDPELEAIRELGVLERHHHKAARALGVSHRTMGLVWLILAAILGVLLVLFLAAR